MGHGDRKRVTWSDKEPGGQEKRPGAPASERSWEARAAPAEEGEEPGARGK